MADGKFVRDRWQTIVETLAIAAIGFGILWQSVSSRWIPPIQAPVNAAGGLRPPPPPPSAPALLAEPVSLAGAERAGSLTRTESPAFIMTKTLRNIRVRDLDPLIFAVPAGYSVTKSSAAGGS